MFGNFKSLFFKNKEKFLLICFGISYRLMLHFFLFDKINLENDSESYQILANRIAHSSLLGYGGERTLGYPLLLFLAGNSFKVAVFYQHILGIISSVFWYKTFQIFNFSNRNSLLIVLFMQSFLNVFFFETSILVESLTLFVFSLVFYLLSNNYIENKKFKIDFLMSFLLGYLTLIKPFFAFIAFVIYGFIVLKDFKFQHIINRRSIVLFFSLLAYFGTSYFNKMNTGSFTSTTFFGYNLAQNCVYFAENGPKKYEWIGTPYAKHRDLILKKNINQSVAMAIWDTYYSGAFNEKNLTFSELSNEMAKYAVETIKNNPKKYLKQVLTKSWLYFWKPTISMDETRLNSENKKKFFFGYWFVQRKFLNVFKYGFLLLVPFYVYTFLKNKKITTYLLTFFKCFFN